MPPPESPPEPPPEPPSPSGLLLRPMRAEDLPAAADLQARAFEFGAWSRAALARDFADHRLSRYFVLTGQSSIEQESATPGLVGMFGCWRMPAELHLVTICVDPASRRRGLGSLLVRLVLALAGREGAATVHLEARSRNAPARALYRNLGFSEDGIRERLYLNPPDDGVLISRAVGDGPLRAAPLPLRIDWGGETEHWPADPSVYCTAQPRIAAPSPPAEAT